jgi:photosystem II stability/assembly factor-like uncharacterized protein
MRRCTFLLAAALLAAVTVSYADWESIGPEGGQVKNVVQSASDVNTLYATSGSYPVRVMKSTDAGLNWIEVGTFNSYDYATSVGPTDVIYAGCYSTVYRSSNGGINWTSGTVTSMCVYDVTAHPTDPSIVFGAGYRYNSSTMNLTFARSTDGGSTWTQQTLEPLQSNGRCVSVAPSSPNIVYVGGYSGTVSPYTPRLFKSTDGGNSFTDITYSGWAGDYYLNSVAVHPTNPDILCVGTQYGIWRSTDGGSTWSDVCSYSLNYDMQWSAANPNVIYSGANGNVYRSTNGGTTWSISSTGLGGTNIRTVVPCRTNPGYAYTGSYAGFFRSLDGGSSWTVSNNGLIVGNILAFGVTPTDPSRIFMQLEEVGVFRTDNNGASWTKLTTPLSCGNFCSLIIHPTQPNNILALEGAG